MLILGIETSCDECSLALVKDGHVVEGMVIYSQLKEHSQYGGVVPELASRIHVKYIQKLYYSLLEQAHISQEEVKSRIGGIAVTNHPGLSGSLIVGLHFAKGLSLMTGLPFIAIDHIQAHFYSGQLMEAIAYPYIGVVVSGGHTLIAIVRDFETIDIKGASIDDACGEAFEKIAREFGLPYPGGPQIDVLAQKGERKAASFPIYSYKKNGYNFSYSGLKTAVLHHRKKYWDAQYPMTIAHMAASFQYAAIEMIMERVEALIAETGIRRVSLGGGVSCNSYLHTRMNELCEEKIDQLVIPTSQLCMDNAAMVAGLGYQYLSRNITSSLDVGIKAREQNYRAQI